MSGAVVALVALIGFFAGSAIWTVARQQASRRRLFGPPVCDASDGELPALAWLAKKVPDVVVLDLRLPQISGVEILHYIRTDPRLVKTRVIVVTAYPKSAVFLQKRADLVLIKPISFVQLRDLARQLRSQSE